MAREIYRHREECPYPWNDGTDRTSPTTSGKMRDESLRHERTGVARVNLGRDDDRRLECGACSALKTCLLSTFSFERDAFSSNLHETRVTVVKDVQSDKVLS